MFGLRSSPSLGVPCLLLGCAGLEGAGAFVLVGLGFPLACPFPSPCLSPFLQGASLELRQALRFVSGCWVIFLLPYILGQREAAMYGTAACCVLLVTAARCCLDDALCLTGTARVWGTASMRSRPRYLKAAHGYVGVCLDGPARARHLAGPSMARLSWHRDCTRRLCAFGCCARTWK